MKENLKKNYKRVNKNSYKKDIVKKEKSSKINKRETMLIQNPMPRKEKAKANQRIKVKIYRKH